MSLNFFFPEKSPAADVDNAESPRGQPAKSGTMWHTRRSILVNSQLWQAQERRDSSPAGRRGSKKRHDGPRIVAEELRRVAGGSGDFPAIGAR